jgi:hypothetical protein
MRKEFFDADWKRFRMAGGCPCSQGCVCFVLYEEGRRQFAIHLDQMQQLRESRSQVVGDLCALMRECFDRAPGVTLDCRCPTDTCHCLYRKRHPLHEELWATEWRPAKARLLKGWNCTLADLGVAGDPAFVVDPEWGEDSFA